MKIGAIIAEYNPFHNGHAYQIQTFRKKYDLDYVIIIMSGNFTQRGEPACMNKYLRTKSALLGGSDLVIELPVCFATSSAPLFSSGAIEHLDQLNCVQHLCFGCEISDTPEIHLKQLNRIADILSEEPDEFKKVLNSKLRSGTSYPAAQEAGLKAILNISDEYFKPNNILAVEYIRSLKSIHSSIAPSIIARKGEGYHSLESNGYFLSATSIRQQLQQHPGDVCYPGISSDTFDIIKNEYSKSMPMDTNDFSPLFLNMLLNPNINFCEYADVTDEIANRMSHYTDQYLNLNDYLQNLKTRGYTYSRLSRCCSHILLNITQSFMDQIKNEGYAYYARILGFKKKSAPLLKILSQNAHIPLITKVADYKNYLSGTAADMFELDLYAANLYRSVSQMKYQTLQKNEFTQPLIIL